MQILLAGGGSSGEAEVSLKTTAAMERALRQAGYQVHRLILQDEFTILEHWSSKYDLLVLGFHGRRSEDGLLQSFLEQYGIPYTGADAAASVRAFHKSLSKAIFARENLPTAAWEVHDHEPGTALARGELNLPFVIKPDNEGSTLGLSVIRVEEDLKKAEKVSGKYRRLIYEKFIPGRELTVAVLGGEALPVVEIFPGHELYDYQSKYTKGLSCYQCPAELEPKLTQRIQELAVQAMEALGVQVYGRVDLRLDEGGQPWLLEINTLPGMTETSLFPMAARAAGMDFPALMKKLVELSLAKYSSTRRT